MNFVRRTLKIQVMQNGIAPNEIEGLVGERQHLRVGLDPFDVHAVADRTITSFSEVAAGKLKPRDVCATSRQNDGRHSVTASEIENAAGADVSQPGDRGANPAFVIEICVVVDVESFCGQIGTASCRLSVVIVAFRCQPGHRVPFA